MKDYIRSLLALIIERRGPRVSAMDDYGNIKAALERAEASTKDIGKLLKSFWDAAAEEDPVAQDAVLQRLFAVSQSAAQDYASLAAEVERARG